MRRYFVFVLIFLLAGCLRFYHLGQTATFGYDSARDMINLREMVVSHKFTLLGPETTIGGKTIFFGPLHYYINAPALIASNFDPLSTYYWTAILSFLAIIFVAVFTKSPAATLFAAVFPWLVSSSQAAWNPNLVPLFATLSLGLFSRRRFLLAGLASGLAIELHYMAVLLPLAMMLVFFLKKEFRWKNVAIFLSGVILGLFPLILFDVRHEFFLTKTIFSLGQSDIATRVLGWYYFLWVPIALAFLLPRLSKAMAVFLIIIALGLTLGFLSHKQPDPILNFSHVKSVADQVLSWEKNSQGNYNIASLSDPDARATAYRYFLTNGGKPPLSFREYSVADHIYAIVPRGISDKTILSANTYEVSVFKPIAVTKRVTIGPTDLVRLDYH